MTTKNIGGISETSLGSCELFTFSHSHLPQGSDVSMPNLTIFCLLNAKLYIGTNILVIRIEKLHIKLTIFFLLQFTN